MHLKQELENRWFLYQVTDEQVFDLFEKGWQAFYSGYDPTADSLHLGNFVVFMQAVNYMKKWNKYYAIVGGATGMIGDPGGKESERSFLDEQTLRHNVDSITAQVNTILKNLKELSWYDFDFAVINNDQFYTDMSYTRFLRDVGKYITVNSMMNKETVKKRIQDPDQSISYTEFSYMLMQAYDYLKLYEDHNVTLQISGSDQRWNIVTGVELIRKKLDKQVYGATGPLVLDSTGKKFGKSEGNAIWLDPNKSSPFSVYQYFMNTTDEDVERYLKLFTLLDFETINTITATHSQDPAARYGQQELAKYVVTTIFGSQAAQQAVAITQLLFVTNDKLAAIQALDKATITALVSATESITVSGEQRILDLCTQSWLTESNSDAKKQIQAGAIYCNEEKVDDIQKMITPTNTINGIVLLRKGKKTYKAVKIS
jgi:tyrosyl-tRNA synthetase